MGNKQPSIHNGCISVMMAEVPVDGGINFNINNTGVHINNVGNRHGSSPTNSQGGGVGQASSNGTGAPPVPVNNSHGSAQSHPHGHPPTLPDTSPIKESERKLNAGGTQMVAAATEVGELVTRTAQMTGQPAAAAIATDFALDSAALDSGEVAVDRGGCVIIQHEMIPKMKKEITSEHASKWIRYLPFFLPSSTGSRRSIGLDGGTVPPSTDNVEKFRVILGTLFEYIKTSGMDAFKEFIVDRFGEEGFKVNGQGPTNFHQCLSIMKNQAVRELCKKVDPLFFCKTLFEIVEGERYESFKLGGLPLKLKEYGAKYEFPFTFFTSGGDNTVCAADGYHSVNRKKTMIHNIIQVGTSGLSDVRRIVRATQLESLSMYAREGKAKKLPDDCWIVDFTFDLVPLDTGCEKKVDKSTPSSLW